MKKFLTGPVPVWLYLLPTFFVVGAAIVGMFAKKDPAS